MESPPNRTNKKFNQMITPVILSGGSGTARPRTAPIHARLRAMASHVGLGVRGGEERGVERQRGLERERHEQRDSVYV